MRLLCRRRCIRHGERRVAGCLSKRQALAQKAKGR